MSFTTHDSKSQNNALQDIKNKDETVIKSEKLASSNDTNNTPQPTKKANNSNDAPQSSNFSSAAQEKKDDESLIKLVNTRAEFDKLVETIKDKYILVWFSATWCRPCKLLAMKFDDLAQKYRNKIEVLKVDVDDLEDLAVENEVSTMPSYMIIRNGQKLAHYIGSKQEHINELIEKYLEDKSG